MKNLKNIFGENFFKKICGKVSNFTLRRTVGFKPVDVLDYDETTYFLGFRIKHVEARNIKINGAILKAVKEFPCEKENPDRIVIKGFVLNKKEVD